MTRKLFLLLVLAIVIPAQAHALSKGYARGAAATGITTAGTTCSCHGALSPDVTVTISGLSTIMAGATQTYTASMTQVLLGAGIGVALGSNPLAGAALGDIEANTRILNSTTSTSRPMILPNLVHNDSALAPPDGNLADWSYDFTLTAPMTLGTIVINAAMLAFNGDEGDGPGDLWNFASRSIQVVPEPSTILLLGTGIAGLAALGRRRLP